MLSNTTERSFVLTSPDELLKYPYEHSLNNSYHECRLFYYVHFGSLRSPHCLALQLDFLTPARWLHDSQLPSCTVQHLKHTIKSVIVERKAKKKKKKHDMLFSCKTICTTAELCGQDERSSLPL